jgi:16S rRNA (cytosine1402-N4)-methyltransferase
VALILRAAEAVTKRAELRVRYHEPVMAPEVMELMGPTGSGLYLDGTVGGGGHSQFLLEICGDCRVVAVDRDPDALAASKATLAPFGGRVRFAQARFDQVLDEIDLVEPLSGALLDLGVSSHHLDANERGFTFRRDVDLDMRMAGEAEGGPTAAELLNEADESYLARIFHEYGEEPRARRLAREVLGRRGTSPFVTSDDLVAALSRALGRAPKVKEKARIFQALRIAVNSELEALELGLDRIREALDSGATLAVISYHSLEDRLVKNAFREWSRSCICPPGIPLCTCRGEPLGSVLTRSPLGPSDIEVARNPRARSARLRAWRKS